MIHIEPADPRDPRAQALVRELDHLMASLYPAESNHLDPAEVLAAADACFLAAMRGEQMLGCGAVKMLDDEAGRYGEIKRVYVSPSARGQGVARRLMAELERRVLALEVTVLRLEAGIHQPEALGLYESLGFRRRGPFGAYGPDPNSVFMEKRLTFRSAGQSPR